MNQRTTWDGCSEVRLEGEFDRAVAERLAPVLERAVRASGDVIVNLDRCDLIDLEVLRMLVDAAARVGERGAQLRFYGAVGQAQRILEVTGVSEKLPRRRLSRRPHPPGNRPVVPVPSVE